MNQEHKFSNGSLLEQNEAAMKTTKTIYLIRHAESQENRRLKCLKSAFRDLGRFSLPRASDLEAATELCRVADQIDSPVSAFGKQQIDYMAKILQESNFMQRIQLVAHSPLQRAVETCFGLLGCKAPDTVPEGTASSVVQLDLLQEKTPTEWFGGGNFPQRLVAFETWIAEQTTVDSIAVVGHSQYFKALLQQECLMGNCDVIQADFDPVSKRWSNVKELHVCRLQPPQEEATDK